MPSLTLQQARDELAYAVEIVKDKLYIAAVRNPDNMEALSQAVGAICFCIDNELVYEPFFADFGPLNLGLAYRFCTRVDKLLQQQDQQPESSRQRIYFCCGADPYRKANAATLMGTYCTLYFGWTADESYKPLMALKPFAPFRDASCGASTFHLTVLDCIRSMEKAKSVGFIDFHEREKCTFNLEEYEYYEQVENGDLNWILPGKFIAFSGPSAKRTEFCGYRTLVPEDYWDHFKRCGVTCVIRLNKKMYEKRRFTDAGIRHHDMYFPDGSCPSEAILKRFLEVTEAEPGVCSVHCKAGLGRTGVLIACYMMKHYKFTANEVIGYIRICRPGSVIGPQQHYLKEMEQKCWRMGDQHRAQLAAQNRVNGSGGVEGYDLQEEEDIANGDRRTSPMKALRSGTRPSMLSSNAAVNATAARLGAGLSISNQNGQGVGLQGAYRAVGSGASAVAAQNGSSAGSNRVRGTPSSGVPRTGGPLSTSVPTFRRTGSPANSSGMVRRSMATTLHTDTASNRPVMRQDSTPLANTVHLPPHSASYGMSQGGGNSQDRASNGLSNGNSLSQYSMAPGSAPSSVQSPTRSAASPYVTRIVTASGQPRKGAAAAAAAAGSYSASQLGGPAYSPTGVGMGPANASPYMRSPFPMRRA